MLYCTTPFTLSRTGAVSVSYTQLVENGTGAPAAGKQMREILGSMKNMRVLEPVSYTHLQPQAANPVPEHVHAAVLPKQVAVLVIVSLSLIHI